MATAHHVIVFADAAALAAAAADRVIAIMQRNPGRIAVCLTGGSSPKKLYELLGTEAYAGRIPWERVHWFIGDDRFVPADDPLNNMGTAHRIFLNRHASPANIHAIATGAGSLNDAARSYEAELKKFYGAAELNPARPLFDLVLMGVGPDGHTASLFPGYPAVDETTRWVVGVPEAHVAPFVPRVSLTMPALSACREMMFMLSGADKRPILTRVLGGEDLPANRARGASGETVWLCDQAALPENFRG